METSLKDSELLQKAINEAVYPLTIITDRYNGSYSHAKYLAFNLDFYDMPDEVGGGDSDEFDFWNNLHTDYIIGKGKSPDEAYLDLYVKLKEAGRIK